MTAPPLSSKQRTLLQLSLVLPYLLGIAWTLGHPAVSVITGEAKCRGWYVDENSLESSYFRSTDKYETARNRPSGIRSMCHALPAVECYSHEGVLEVARIVPTEGAIAPVSEALVLLIPSTKDWLTSDFHFAVTQLVERLSSSAWLAKTVLIVAPSDAQLPMVDTVETFLDAYLGSTTNVSIPMLPPQITSAMLRNVLVVQHFVRSGGPVRADLKILPQGRRGVLPNMDLVFHAMSIYSRANFMDPRRNPSTIFVHPYVEKSVRWREYVGKHLPRQYHEWAMEVVDMGLFAYTLAMGPYAPHAPALARGVDSLTLELNLGGKHPRSQGPAVVEFVQQLEHVIHGLSNLHERLHHSLTLYVLPSPYKFVSHSEYIIPNVLLLVPLLVKVLVLLLVEVEFFDLSAVGKAFTAVMVGVTCLVVASANTNLYQSNGVFFVAYMAVGLSFRQVQYTHKFATKSLLLMACLVAIYSHVPLVIGHASLAYPSSLLWTPFLLMFNYETRSIRQRLVGAVILLVTWPPLFLIPNIFGTPTPYMCLVYTPLHLLLAMLWNSGR
jgi:hypothetical protein